MDNCTLLGVHAIQLTLSRGDLVAHSPNVFFSSLHVGGVKFLNHQGWASRSVSPFFSLVPHLSAFKPILISPYTITIPKSILFSGYMAEALLIDISFFFG